MKARGVAVHAAAPPPRAAGHPTERIVRVPPAARPECCQDTGNCSSPTVSAPVPQALPSAVSAPASPGGFMASGGVVTMAGLAGRGGRSWKLAQPLLPAAVTGRPVYR